MDRTRRFSIRCVLYEINNNINLIDYLKKIRTKLLLVQTKEKRNNREKKRVNF